MQRDLRQLADTRFDLVIVGAGIYGAIAAWDATLRGLSVAIVDRGDFGGGTSFNNLKTLHGGLRSLQALNVRQMRRFIRERRALARVAPHLVRTMGFVAPTYRHPMRSAAALRAALAINDLVARDRHAGLTDPALRLPNGRVMTRAECLTLNPMIDPSEVTGGALWYDYQMHNADRVTLSFVLSAAARGAVAANHVRATRLLRAGTRVAGVSVRDAHTSVEFEVRARAVLNATGPWAASWLASLTPPLTLPASALSRAMNVITRHVEVPQGCAGLAGGRFLFLIPWRGATLIGTSHDPHGGCADDLTVTADQLERFMDDVRQAFPRARLTADDVRLVHRGLLPSTGAPGHHVRLLRESQVIDHGRDGVVGLFSMIGVRYTTARHTAAKAVDALFAGRGETPPKCTTDVTPVVGGAIESLQQLRARVSDDRRALSEVQLRRLVLTYGTTFGDVVQLAHDDPELARTLAAGCDVTGAEILHAVRHEAAVTLSDAILRRTEAGSAGHPGDEVIASAATLMAHELGWSAERTADEIAAVNAFYRLPG